jgi:hypothetical protein
VEGDGGPGEFLGDGVAAVTLDAREDEGSFRGGEEGATGYGRGVCCAVREVDDGKVSEEAEEDSYGAFLRTL